MANQGEGIGEGKEPANNRYWVSFDLGLMGDYSQFYQWLDSIHAEECGPGLATFTTSKTRDELEAELQGVRVNSPRARFYVISKNHDGNLVGKFLAGGRKAAPWSGYAERSSDVEDVA